MTICTRISVCQHHQCVTPGTTFCLRRKFNLDFSGDFDRFAVATVEDGPKDEKDGIAIVWGESKVYKDISEAFESACQSISEFLGTMGSEPLKDRDVQIVRDHLNLPPGKARAAIISAMDPYSDTYNKTKEEFACLIGFQFHACVPDKTKGSVP